MALHYLPVFLVALFVPVTAASCATKLCTVLSQFADPSFIPDDAMRRGVLELKRSLVVGGYTVSNVVRETGTDLFTGLDSALLSQCGGQRCAPLAKPHEASPLNIAISLFIRHSEVPRVAAERALGVAGVRTLVDLGVLDNIDSATLKSLVHLSPIDDVAHIVTDFNFHPLDEPGSFQVDFDPVMSLGIDTAALAYGAPRNATSNRLLDLCTGSGVQGIVAAMHYAADVTLVDLNPRAVQFARFNLLLNGIPRERSRVYQGSLYDALPTGTQGFDTILANPPFLPGSLERDPRSHLALFGVGGHLGYEVTQGIISGAGKWLFASARGGEAVRIVADIYNHDDYEELLRGWVGKWAGPEKAGGVNIGLFTGEVWSRDELDRRGLLAKRNMDDSRNIRTGGNSLIFVSRRSDVEGTGLVGFRRRKLHSLMWFALRSETVARPLMQFLLARAFDPPHKVDVESSVTYYTAKPAEIADWGDALFTSVWEECATSHHVDWVASNRVDVFAALPRMVRERVLICVDERLVVPRNLKCKAEDPC
jgi:hypothetical protein